MKKEDYPYLTSLDADFKLLNKLIADIEAWNESGLTEALERKKAQYFSPIGIEIINKLWDRSYEWHDNRDHNKDSLLDEEIWKAVSNGEKENYRNYSETIFGNQFKHINLVVPERLKRFKKFYHESWIEFLKYGELKNDLTTTNFIDILQFILIATYQSLEEQFASSFELYQPSLTSHITKYDSDYIKPICLNYGDNNDKVLLEIYTHLINCSLIYVPLDEFRRHFTEGEHPDRIIWLGLTKHLVALFNGVVILNDPMPLKWLLTSNDIILTIHEHFSDKSGARISMETIKTTVKRGPFEDGVKSEHISKLLKKIYEYKP